MRAITVSFCWAVNRAGFHSAAWSSGTAAAAATPVLIASRRFISRGHGSPFRRPASGYHRSMATLRVTEAELARDPHAILEKVRDEGAEVVVVEQNQRALA